MPSETKNDDAVRKVQVVQSAFIASIGREVIDCFGEAGLEAIKRGLYKAQTSFAPTIARRAGVRTGNGGIQDWIDFQSYLARINNNEVQVEVGPNRGVLSVPKCAMGDKFRDICPEFCRKAYIAVEEATAHCINPKMKVRWERTIPEGQGACELICEL